MFTLGCVYDSCSEFNGLLKETLNFWESVLSSVIVKRLLLNMIENKAVVKYPHLQVGKTKVIHAVLGQPFPVTYSVIRNIADCSADKTEFRVWNCLVFKQALYSLERVTCFLGYCFACFFVSDLGFSVFGLNSYFWVESDEGVLCEFFGAFD